MDGLIHPIIIGFPEMLTHGICPDLQHGVITFPHHGVSVAYETYGSAEEVDAFAIAVREESVEVPRGMR